MPPGMEKIKHENLFSRQHLGARDLRGIPYYLARSMRFFMAVPSFQ